MSDLSTTALLKQKRKGNRIIVQDWLALHSAKIFFPSKASAARSEITSGRRKSSCYGSSGKQRRKTPPPSAIPIEKRFPKVSNALPLKQPFGDKDEDEEIAS